ncbi:hypothetical protein [Corynebacterium striatum]|uniref:hypothetical protein n=1 Tax=Corynebacterium striatum TaxID=43770 RepID=UPI003B5CC071
MTDFNGKVQGRFVDDDDIVRTGRAMIELDGYGFMQVPIPTGLKQAWDDLRGESSSSLSEIRSKAAQAAESAGAASKSAAAAKTSESNAASSKSAAASSAVAAGKSESNAASSAAAAKQSETAAAGSASGASSSAAAAKTSESNAASSASSAKQSENSAAASKSAAAGSAAEAKTSASSAKQDADRAVKARTGIEEIAATTSWSGDKLTVNGKTSPSLTGPPGPKGDTGSVENVSWADISGKPDLASTWEQVKGKPATYPPAPHTHTTAQVEGLDAALAGKADKGHKHKIEDVDGVADFLSGASKKIEAKADKSYVDNKAAEARSFAASRAVVKQVTSPPSTYESGVLYVIPE